MIQNRLRQEGRTSPLDLIVRTICQPIATLSNKTFDGVTGFFQGALRGNESAVENERLKRQIESLSLYSENIKRLEEEVDSLRALAGQEPTYKREKVRADVIFFSAIAHRITIAAGRDKGIEPGMPVVNAAGLVGRVETVAPKECQALLITSAASKVGGIALDYKPAPAGLVVGDNSATVIMGFQTDQPPVKSGDIIVTSGFSDKLPRGIPRGITIGRVLSTEPRPEVGASRAIILPKVSLGNLREVVILK